MKYMKKIFVFGAILSCVVFLGMRFHDSYASINTERDYILKGEPNTYHETISLNTNGTGSDYTLKGEPNIYHETISLDTNDTSKNYTLKGEPNTYHETISTNASSRGGDYILRGELNIYRETFSAVSNDIDSYNSEGMYSGDVVIAEPTPLPWQ